MYNGIVYMKIVCKQWALAISVLSSVLLGLFLVNPAVTHALNILEYSDTLSDSGPSQQSNHTLSFTLSTALSAGSVIELTPPPGFAVMSTTTFDIRNVELLVNGGARNSAVAVAPGVDMVEITAGSPGFLSYTLAPDFNIASGSFLELKIGNHTSGAILPITSFSTSTGTTTTPGDIEPIVNSVVLGLHQSVLQIFDGALVAEEEFIIFLNEKVSVPNTDTRENIPPYRFNPTPTSSIGGTTLSVEISLETDELAICKYDLAPGIDFATMPNTFSNTGFIFHSVVVAVTQGALNQFYVRCIDDEGNFNITDFIIAFVVNDAPTGTANTDGAVDGDGTGTGDDGTGDGSGGGGETGDADGELPLEGGSSGTGGSGGGGGGGSGTDTGTTAPGGFESTDGIYQSGDGRVIISGHAYPNSTVGILVDGNFFDNANANSTGQYSITLDEIARGVYTFGVYGEGPDGVRSSVFSTSFTVTGSRTSALGNVNVAPSILVTPDPVNPGETLTVSGYALPDSSITIQNGRINTTATKDFFATSDSRGRWSTTLDTGSFTVDTYQVRAKAEQVGGESTHYSEYTFYGVGQEADLPINSYLNRDGKVNLIDFSILLFWWNTNGGDSDPPADINRDGNVSLTDFSILLFNWTG